jgi:hypothetical protein
LPASLSTPLPDPTPTRIDDETATLNSLEQVDNYPLYTMHYIGSYAEQARSYRTVAPPNVFLPSAQGICQANWGCSLFAALGDKEDRLFGRNFDWQFSPALLLFTDPPDGYASVSMVDIEYLGFTGDRSKKLADLPLAERRNLLDKSVAEFSGKGGCFVRRSGYLTRCAQNTHAHSTPNSHHLRNALLVASDRVLLRVLFCQPAGALS